MIKVIPLKYYDNGFMTQAFAFGGTLGATAIWYKNDFFTALTANVGAGVAERIHNVWF